MTWGVGIEWFSDRSVAIFTEQPEPAAQTLAVVLARTEPALIVHTGLDMILVEAPAPSVQLRDWVTEAWAGLPTDASARDAQAITHTIPVRYDGADIEEVSAAMGLTHDEFVSAHCTEKWRVAMLGFAPGFGYLRPENSFLWKSIPRRTSPRASVPSGSVALAAGMSAVYPRALPGGWNLIGTTDTTFFNPEDSANPTLLHPGDIVVFEVQT